MTGALSDNLLRLSVFGPLVLAWEVAVRLSGTSGRYPSPGGIAAALADSLGSGALPTAVGQSLSRVAMGFLAAAAVGILLGLLIGRSRAFDRGLSPIVNALRSIAPIAWIPMAVLWLGVTGKAAIFIVAYAAVFPILLNTAQAVHSVDRRYIGAAQTLGAGRLMLLTSVVFRSALPTVVTGARIGMGFAWASIIAAELAMGIKLETGGQVRAGLGQLMVGTLYVDRDVDALLLYMLTIGLIGLAIDLVMRRLHRAAAPWEHG